MGAAVPGPSRGHTEAAHKVWPHSESGGPTSPHPPTKTAPVLALFRWAVLGRGSWRARFWARMCPGLPAGTRRPLAKFGPIPSPADQLSPTPPPRLSPTPRFGPFPLGGFGTGAFGRSFLRTAVPGASRGYTEAASKVWTHFESGGPTLPHPPTKAIAHPPFWPFSAGRFWDGVVGALVFGRGYARGIPRAHGGR